jgi:DNA-binding HxlR family transcriptional regulator
MKTPANRLAHPPLAELPSAANLDRLIHEPSRLAVISVLAAEAEGVAFNELKASCALSDGNLSRHLRALEQGGLVHLTKSFVGVKPRTTVCLTELGRARFLDYLQLLEKVLRQAAEAMETGEAPARQGLGQRTARIAQA